MIVGTCEGAIAGAARLDENGMNFETEDVIMLGKPQPRVRGVSGSA